MPLANMRLRVRSVVVLHAALAVGLVSAPAHAQTPAPPPAAPAGGPAAAPPPGQATAAEALFEQGRKALAEGDLATACARFRASDQIDPAPGTKANIAECEERRGHVATAWELNRTALAALAPDDARRAILQRRIAKLEPRLPRLVLSLPPTAPRETTVRDGQATLGVPGSYGVPLPLDAGAHHLDVVAPGCASASIDVTLTEGHTETVALPACVPEVKGSGSAGAGPWVLGGVGVAALIAGGVTGGLTLAKQSAVSSDGCKAGPPPTCPTQAGVDAADKGRTLGVVTTAMLVTGAAAVAGAGVWLGVSRGKAPPRVGFVPSPSGGGVRVEGSW
jgi:hypothetical protein